MKSYLITDPRFFHPFTNGFCRSLSTVYRRKHPDYCCLRDKAHPNYPQLARRFLRQGKRFKTRMLLHGDWRLAKKLGAYGVHLPESKRREIAAARRAGLFVVASCHTQEGIKRALRQGALLATLSPVFESPGKGTPLGVSFLKGCDAKIKPKIIALGGIVTAQQVASVAQTGIGFFASIRYFVQKEN